VEISLVFGEISKGLVERGGSLLFGFPRFPQPRHFHNSLLFAICVILLPLPDRITLYIGDKSYGRLSFIARAEH
jgi:hypothetical protein